MPGKVPTRSPTHEEIPIARLPGMGLELEDIANGDGVVALDALVELAEDRGRPASNYLAAIPLASELTLAPLGKPVTVRVCAGTCQRYGALELLDYLVGKRSASIVPVECLDQCDHGPAVEVHGPSGKLLLAPASFPKLDEAIAALA